MIFSDNVLQNYEKTLMHKSQLLRVHHSLRIKYHYPSPTLLLYLSPHPIYQNGDLYLPILIEQACQCYHYHKFGTYVRIQETRKHVKQ